MVNRMTGRNHYRHQNIPSLPLLPCLPACCCERTMLSRTRPSSPSPCAACVSISPLTTSKPDCVVPYGLKLRHITAACRLPGGVDSDSSLWRMLMEKRTGQTPKVPASRFNIDAHLHQNLERPGSFNVPGGYFLDGSPEDFDPTFFGITPVEAQWLDPQQRKMLEVSYECLESAGVTLDAIAGSNTAVFVGSFTSDYRRLPSTMYNEVGRPEHRDITS